MKIEGNEIIIFYRSDINSDREAVANAHGISSHVKAYEFGKSGLTAQQWKQVLDRLDMEPRELLDDTHSKYNEYAHGRTFSAEDWLHVLTNNSDMIKGPIAMSSEKALLCRVPSDVHRLNGGAPDVPR